MLNQPSGHVDRMGGPTGITGEFRDLARQLTTFVPPEDALKLKRKLQEELPAALGSVVHRTLDMMLDRLDAQGDDLLSTDRANDGDAAIGLDADAKDFIRRALTETCLKDFGYDVVGEGIGGEDRTFKPNGWIWIVIDPLDGSKYFETTGEGAAVVVGAFMQVAPRRVERLAVAIASTAARTTVTTSHTGTVRVSRDGVGFYELDRIPVGRMDAVAMVTGRNPDNLVYLAALAERLGVRADSEAGNPGLPKLLLWGSSLIVQPGPHKVYDALWLYSTVRRDDLFALDVCSGERLNTSRLDDAVSAWINRGCQNDHRTVDPYVVATRFDLANRARLEILELGLLEEGP